MSEELFIAVMFAGVLLGLLAGHPVAFVLAGLAVLFGYMIMGDRIWPLFINRMWQTSTNQILIAIPLFVFMASILERSGIAEGLFRALMYAFGALRGAIALAVVVLSTVFAAITGVMGATVVSMSLMAIPTMLRYNYSKTLATGVVAASGTLGIIIPPSIMLILMADQSNESVGRLFAAGIMPGIVLASLYFIYILVRSRQHPGDGAGAAAGGTRRASPPLMVTRMLLVNLVPPLFLIFGVLGSIWGGYATPTEASAIGAFVALILMVVYQKFDWRTFAEAVWTATRTSCMVIAVIVGATMFTIVFQAAGGRAVVTDLVHTLDFFGRWGVFAAMMLIVFLLGFLIDWIGIILITFPIFLPISRALGFDELWFVMMMAVNLQASFLTPPVGYALFYLKGTVPKGVSMMDIYKGILPFLVVQFIAVIILTIFPGIVTWLPNLVIR
jgi:tripartite ATP-independent transporter DctM subunit